MTNNNASYPFFAVLDELLDRGILPAKLTVGQVTAEFVPVVEKKEPIKTNIDESLESLESLEYPEDEKISFAKKQEAFEKTVFFSS